MINTALLGGWLDDIALMWLKAGNGQESYHGSPQTSKNTLKLIFFFFF